jgi:uncharacterized protein YgiM (DUF1202 family)
LKKNTLYIIGRITLVFVGGYFIYRKLTSKKTTQVGSIQEPIQNLDDNIIKETTKTSSPFGSVLFSLLGYDNYMVTEPSINVHEKPNAKSKIIEQLKRFQTIKARFPTRGWSEVSKDGKNTYGFVESRLLSEIKQK